MGAILGRLAAALGLAAVIAIPRASAQFWNDPVTEEEARTFITVFSDELVLCDSDSVAAHFLPWANVQLIHADGTQETLSPSDRTYIRKYCNPYRTNPFKITREDRWNVQFTQTGSAMTVAWEVALGGQGWVKRGPPKVVFNSWVELVKDNHTIRVAGAGWQARDLVPGGEEEYFTRLYEGSLSYRLKKFYHAVAHSLSDIYGDIEQRLREWSEQRRKTAGRDDASTY